MVLWKNIHSQCDSSVVSKSRTPSATALARAVTSVSSIVISFGPGQRVEIRGSILKVEWRNKFDLISRLVGRNVD